MKFVVNILAVLSVLAFSNISFADQCSDRYGAGYYNGTTITGVTAGPVMGSGPNITLPPPGACLNAAAAASAALNANGAALCGAEPAPSTNKAIRTNPGVLVPGVPNGTNGTACDCVHNGTQWDCTVSVANAEFLCCNF